MIDSCGTVHWLRGWCRERNHPWVSEDENTTTKPNIDLCCYPVHIRALFFVLETLIVCEGGVACIRCRPGQTIKILYANFGRTADDTVCPYNMPSIPTADCQAPGSLTKVMEWCEGKNLCDVKADNHVFGDPCPKTFKYLEVHYTCV